MENIFLILIPIAGLIIGIILGIFFARFFIWRQNKIQQKNAKKVLEGKRDNQITLEGQVIKANKFRVRDESGKEMIIDLKGGGKTEYAKENKEKRSEIQRKGFGTIRTDSRSYGEEKRTPRRRNGRRIRRFG